MKHTTYIQVLIILLLTGITASAQPDKSDAVYLDQVKEYTLKQDGSWTYHYSQKLKLLTYFAIHNLYGEDFIVYNPVLQKLKINRSVTTMADGTRVNSPENAFNELLPGYAANAPDYNNLREMAVTHTGLERGAVIDFDYTLTSSKEFSAAMTGNELLWMNSPVEKLTFIINVPAGTALNYQQYNISVKPVIIKGASGTTYTWTLTNLPAATREDFRPKEQQNRPRIVFSTAKNAAKLFGSFVSQPAFSLQADPDIQNKVKAIRDKEKSSLGIMMRIQDLVANEVNYQPVPLAVAGYKVRTAPETFSGNGGSECEKAVLLASMLSAAGINSEVIAVLPERYYDKNSCNLQLIERFLVKATPVAEESYYLSPLQNDLQDQRFTLAGKKLIGLTPGNSFGAETEKIAGNSIDLTGNLVVASDMSITGKVRLELGGRLNPSLKLAQDSAFAKRQLSGAFETAQIKSCTIEKLNREQAVITSGIEVKDGIKELEGHYFLKIPSLSSGIDGWHMTELVSQRTEPFELPFPLNENYSYTIDLPEGYEMITPEVNLKLKKDFGDLVINIVQDGRTLQINRSIHLEKTFVEPSGYADVRLLLNTWNNKKYREIIFRKGPK